MEKHYAKRMPPISFSFGIFDDVDLVGVVTYGVPVSAPLRGGICGPHYADCVYELNRLCTESRKNIASQLVGRSMAMMPKPSVIVSYADIGQGHIGYVYQACNFIYTGLSANRTDWKIKGLEHLHGASVADMSRGQTSRVKYMRDKFGDDFYLEPRARKHRYIYFVGNRTQKKAMQRALLYKQESYPKGDSQRYDAGGSVSTQYVMF